MVNSTRRQFIQTGMASGITLATAAQPVWSANANNEVNLGFIGCGGRGNILMSAFSKVSGVTVEQRFVELQTSQHGDNLCLVIDRTSAG